MNANTTAHARPGRYATERLAAIRAEQALHSKHVVPPALSAKGAQLSPPHQPGREWPKAWPISTHTGSRIGIETLLADSDETLSYRVGNHWIAKRPGSPCWYMLWTDADARNTRRLSTHTSDFHEARRILEDYVALCYRQPDFIPSKLDPGELVRPIPCFGGYFATTHGRIIGPRRRFLRQMQTADGHMQVGVTRGDRRSRGKQMRKNVHQLVLFAFVGPKPKGRGCRHLDDHPWHNALANLCWGTTRQNARDMVRNKARYRKARAAFDAAQAASACAEATP